MRLLQEEDVAAVANSLTWHDDYFDRERQILVGGPSVIAVFDYDYDAKEEFAAKRIRAIVWGTLAASSLYCAANGALLNSVDSYSYYIDEETGGLERIDYDPLVRAMWGALVGAAIPFFVFCLCGLCFDREATRWQVRAQHLAVTDEGIRLVQERHRRGCGWSMCDSEKSSRTVPFDQIDNCDVYEPSGSVCCCCVPRTLFVVHIATTHPSAAAGGGGSVFQQVVDGGGGHSLFQQVAYGGGGPPHLQQGQYYQHYDPSLFQLRVEGLKEPYQLHRLVWAMKRARRRAGSTSTYLPV
jgi:hypothetical protein